MVDSGLLRGAETVPGSGRLAEAMPKPIGPDLKKFMNKRVSVTLNAGREV